MHIARYLAGNAKLQNRCHKEKGHKEKASATNPILKRRRTKPQLEKIVYQPFLMNLLMSIFRP
jgi:hypothetical protein